MKKIKAIKFLSPEQTKINGEFDFSVEVEYNKSQVTENKAIKSGLEQINKILDPNLCAKLSESEQRVQSDDDDNQIEFGCEIYSKK